MCFDKSPFTCRYEKDNRKAQGFQSSPFHWPLSSDTMAVKGLRALLKQAVLCKAMFFVVVVDNLALFSALEQIYGSRI